MEQNISYALVNTLKEILHSGAYITTRGNNQREILSHLTHIKNPNERVVVMRNRNNNIFALIAETMWVLSGRDDMEFLSHYLPRAVDFSDDGKKWRAAYGPRLRNWNGVDQFKEVARILNADRNTKRAAMIIYNPELDYIETKDVPCNNWLHFMIRDEKLHLNVAVRANDAIWGFGGINNFEWSILQEMMAFWTNSNIGELSWFTGTIHTYERHYKTSKAIVESFENRTLYDYGFTNPRFSTPLDKFDDEMEKWFMYEQKIRSDKYYDLYQEIYDIEDELLRSSLEMIYLYNQYLHSSSKEHIIKLIENLPSNDFKIAAIEYFSRVYKKDIIFNLLDTEKEFFDFYWDEIKSKDPTLLTP